MNRLQLMKHPRILESYIFILWKLLYISNKCLQIKFLYYSTYYSTYSTCYRTYCTYNSTYSFYYITTYCTYYST